MSAPRPAAETRGNGLIGVLGTISLVLAVFAPIMGISGGISFSNAQSLTQHSVSTTAEVVAVELRTTGTKYRHHYYFTAVSFEESDGRSVTTELPRTSDEPDYAVGDSIAIAYDSTKPTNASLESELRYATVGGLVMIGIGVASAIAVLIMVLVMRRVFRGNRSATQA